jgi:hypothetical protein
VVFWGGAAVDMEGKLVPGIDSILGSGMGHRDDLG